jgi:hypothetical protein
LVEDDEVGLDEGDGAREVSGCGVGGQGDAQSVGEGSEGEGGGEVLWCVVGGEDQEARGGGQVMCVEGVAQVERGVEELSARDGLVAVDADGADEAGAIIGGAREQVCEGEDGP